MLFTKRLKKMDGYQFEKIIFSILEKFYDLVYHEKDLIKSFGNCFVGVDFLVVSEKEKYIIPIQCKYTSSTIKMKEISHFKDCVGRISQLDKFSGFKIHPLYLSKKNITRNGVVSLKEINGVSIYSEEGIEFITTQLEVYLTNLKKKEVTHPIVVSATSNKNKVECPIEEIPGLGVYTTKKGFSIEDVRKYFLSLNKSV